MAGIGLRGLRPARHKLVERTAGGKNIQPLLAQIMQQRCNAQVMQGTCIKAQCLAQQQGQHCSVHAMCAGRATTFIEQQMQAEVALGGQLGHIVINCGIAARACQLWLGLRQCLNGIKAGLRCMKARAQHLYIGRPMLHLLRMRRKAGCICNLLGRSLVIGLWQ